MAPADLAKQIIASVTPGTGICPVCAAVHKLAAKGGRLPRHGFTAKNVRRGQNSGFHIGGHGGDFPIGTAAGNALALRIASQHNTLAAELAAMAPFTIEDASADARQEMFSYERKRSSSLTAPPTEDEVKTDIRWVSCRHWLSRGSLEGRRERMERSRAQTIQDHRNHAALLAALVELQPAKGGA